MYTCIVIDDERLARTRITDFVSEQSQWQVIGEVGEYTQAHDIIVDTQPDLCFVDINIIGGSGVQLVSHLSSKTRCKWVFTTGYTEFAIRAFELSAFDYILKPFENNRLRSVLNKVEQHQPLRLNKCKNMLAVKSVGAVDFVEVSDIIWIKGSANYVELHCINRMLLHRETLSNLALQLDTEHFVRVHRSAIINIKNVRSLSSELGRFSLLHMKNGDEVKIGQGYKCMLFEKLGLDPHS